MKEDEIIRKFRESPQLIEQLKTLADEHGFCNVRALPGNCVEGRVIFGLLVNSKIKGDAQVISNYASFCVALNRLLGVDIVGVRIEERSRTFFQEQARQHALPFNLAGIEMVISPTTSSADFHTSNSDSSLVAL
jgi:hypothetical protein